MWNWFLHYWSSVGLGAGIVLLILALFTNVLRQDLSISRWRDPVWLAWASAVAYMLHNFEEYGIDLYGRPFHFPTLTCQTFGYTDTASCPITPEFFLSVNIPAVWIALVAAALIARRVPVVGLTGAGLLLTNALSHVSTLFTSMGYSSGTLTAVVLFIPLSLWIFATQFGKGKQRIPQVFIILLASLVVQGVLLVMLSALSHHAISTGLACTIQSLDDLLILVIPWLANRVWRPFTVTSEGSTYG